MTHLAAAAFAIAPLSLPGPAVPLAPCAGRLPLISRALCGQFTIPGRPPAAQPAPAAPGEQQRRGVPRGGWAWTQAACRPKVEGREKAEGRGARVPDCPHLAADRLS
jgi:hypothetical protein